MAKLKEAYFHKNIKLGKSYNSSGIACSVTLQVDEDENMQDVSKQGWKMVDDELEREIRKVAAILERLGE